MAKFRKYEQRIRKYKDKLIKFVTRIGISYSEEFELADEGLKKLILPCHLGVLFYTDLDNDLFKLISSCLNQVFDSFFFDIRDLGQFHFTKDLISKGVKKEYKEMRKVNNKLITHPTNKFYQILINIRKEEKLGVIVLLTDLPIYSSSDDTIVFMFGETHLKHRCSVVSTLKLKEEFYDRHKDEKVFKQRVIKEIIHEVGHILIGSSHCERNSCVMKFSEDVEDIDKKSYNLCESCKSKLDNIRAKFNF
jgi:predicted Zn-dependent protease